MSSSQVGQSNDDCDSSSSSRIRTRSRSLSEVNRRNSVESIHGLVLVSTESKDSSVKQECDMSYSDTSAKENTVFRGEDAPLQGTTVQKYGVPEGEKNLTSAAECVFGNGRYSKSYSKRRSLNTSI